MVEKMEKCVEDQKCFPSFFPPFFPPKWGNGGRVLEMVLGPQVRKNLDKNKLKKIRRAVEAEQNKIETLTT